jgi:alpha-L-fucosidase
MTRRCLVPALLVALLLADRACPLPPRGTDPDHEDRMAWWRDARFGMFIHWGLYAIPAGRWGDRTGYGEWILHSAQIPVETYEQLAGRFDPVRFDADAWARLARDAGMKYIVITTKHHDGFCLFDSAHTDYDVTATPFGRDIMAELADAARRHGLRIGWYHSIMDWHHPDYLPRRGWETRSAEGADFERYVRHLRAQVTELLTRYGDIGVMWFDGQWEGTWTHEHGRPLYELCRELQPDVIVNNRVDKGGLIVGGELAGDYGTPEQEIPGSIVRHLDWETCMTMNRHWGYNRLDDQWKSTEQLIRALVEIASKGGNFLLNVGPTAAGEIPAPSVERLQAMGRWLAVNGEAIHGTEASPFDDPLPWGRCTMRSGEDGTRLYLHVTEWPADGAIVLPGIGNDAIGATLLAAPQRAPAVRRAGGDLVIDLPGESPDPACSVVALDVAGAPVIYETPAILAESPIFVHPLQIRLATRSDALEIRYTLDGSEPTVDARRYDRPFWLTGTTVVSARSFHQGRPVSPLARLRLERAAPRPGDEVVAASPGLRCETFEGDWDRLPDMDRLEPVAVSVMPEVSLPAASVRAERLGHRFTGWIEVPRDDVYRFALRSDDGSRLLVGGAVVVDNDGLHGSEERTGQAALAAGLHPIRVEWFNKTGGTDLRLRWAAAGEPWRDVGSDRLRH